MDFVDHIWYNSFSGDGVVIDVYGIELTPGNGGENCKGNGNYFDEQGNRIECCCDECDYLICCVSEKLDCDECTDNNCPRKLNF